MGWTRRRFLAGIAAVSAAPLALAAQTSPITPAAAFDEAIGEFMKERNVPGGALAVARNGKLVCARGYGWADRETKAAARPDSLFRIASLSKPITGVAVLKLVEDGRLKDHWYGCGWHVRPARDSKHNCWHNGSLPGTYTLLVRRWDGITFAALFNQRSENWQRGDDALDPALNRAANSVTEWPEHDLFEKGE